MYLQLCICTHLDSEACLHTEGQVRDGQRVVSGPAWCDGDGGSGAAVHPNRDPEFVDAGPCKQWNMSCLGQLAMLA